MEFLKGLNETKLELEKKGVFDDGFENGETDFAELAGIVDVVNAQGIPAKWDTKRLLQMNMSWVYACVDAIGDEVAQTDFKLWSINKTKLEEVTESPILDLLWKPNNFFTKFDLLKLVSAFLSLTGEAPLYVVKDSKGIPTKLVLLDPAYLTLVPAKETDETDMVSNYLYRVYTATGYQELKLEVDEVVFLRDPDPNNQFRGRGPLSAMKNTHELDLLAEQYNKDFFKNSATPSMVLSTEKTLDKKVLERLQLEIKEKYEGHRNRHKTLILSHGLKKDSASSSHADMQFVEQQKFSRDKILAMFRVPPTILGITEDVNRANAEASKYVFAERVIKPKLIRISEQLTEFLLPMFKETKVMFVDFENPVPENKEFILKSATDGYREGIMTLNEAREMLRLDPVKDGESFKPVGTNPFAVTPVNDGNNQASKILNKHLFNKMMVMSKRVEKKVAIEQTALKIVESKVKQIVFDRLHEQATEKSKKEWKIKEKHNKKLFADKEAKYKFQQKQYNVSDQYELKMQGVLNGLFEAQKKIIKDSLELMKDKPNPDGVVLNVDKQQDEFIAKLQPLYGSLIDEQARLARLLIGSEKSAKGEIRKVSQFDKVIQNFILGKIVKLATETTKTTNEKLQQALIDGISAQESIAQIADRINAVFDNANTSRALMIARTETIRATNFASEQAYKESEVVVEKEWLAELDERTDDECARLDGKVVSVGGKFKTEEGNLPYPPIHPNCRCTIIPVVK